MGVSPANKIFSTYRVSVCIKLAFSALTFSMYGVMAINAKKFQIVPPVSYAVIMDVLRRERCLMMDNHARCSAAGHRTVMTA